MGKREGLAKKLKTLREDRGWSQAKLAMLSGVTRSHISVIELGRIKNPRSDVLIKLAQAVKVPVGEFFAAAGYIGEAKSTYDYKETPEQVLENIKSEVHRLGKMLEEK